MIAELLLRPVPLASWLAVGACLYLILLNRVLLLLRDGRLKRPLVYGSFVIIELVATGLAATARSSMWNMLPAWGLLAVACGEIWRLITRHRCRGAPPAEQLNRGLSFAQPCTTTDLAVSRYELSVPQWKGPRLRVAHVSDLHVDDRLPFTYYQSALACAGRANPDLILLTGDFVTRLEYLCLLAELLPAARARHGVLAVLGNHDYWAGAAEVRCALRQAGVTLLGNGYQRLAVGEENVLIAGCESPWGGDDWQPPMAGPRDLILCLTHTPDNVYRLSRAGMTAIFAGHSHAGQICAPWLGPMVIPSVYGRRFDHGHFVVNGTHLFVTAGVGSASPPYRIYCQPDLFIVDIVGAHG